ncbi:hypothetical protein [Coleofasciculus sp.]
MIHTKSAFETAFIPLVSLTSPPMGDEAKEESKEKGGTKQKTPKEKG